MANKGTIDPAFQAAPYLGDSSHDPIEFTKRQVAIKYQRAKQKQAETERDITKGLDKLTLDLKDLYGEKGIDEVLRDQATTKDVWVKLYKAGARDSSTNPLAIKGLQAITKKQEESLKKVDVLTANKAILDSYSKAYFEDSKLPKEKQMFDHEAGMVKIEAAKKEVEKKGILETQGIFDNILVKNPTPGDLDKYVTQFKDFIPKVNIDPVSGEPNRTQLKEQKDYMEKVFATLPENELKVLEDLQKRVPAYKVAPLKDIFMDLYSPAAAGKLSKPIKETSGGTPFNFLGASGDMSPGEHQTNDVRYAGTNFNNRYDFSFKTAKTFFIPPLGGEYSTEDEWKPITGAGGPLEGNLQFYDANNDELIFKLSQDARYPWIKNNTTIKIPRKNLAKADSLPIKLPNGKIGTLKDLLPEQPTTKKFPVNWSKPTTPYIPKTNK